jgi:hypothetical protein
VLGRTLAALRLPPRQQHRLQERCVGANRSSATPLSLHAARATGCPALGPSQQFQRYFERYLRSSSWARQSWPTSPIRQGIIRRSGNGAWGHSRRPDRQRSHPFYPDYPTFSREVGRNSAPLLGSFAQNSFESGVEISPHLCHPLIAILAEERRWPVIFEDSTALLVLEQNNS